MTATLAPLEIHMIREMQEIHMTLLVMVVVIIMREQIHVLVPSRDARIEQFLFLFLFYDF